MSKSKGNVVTPMSLLEQYGSDAVRYWAASARPGTDTAFDEGQMRIGRKLAIKILNVSRFVLEAGAGARRVRRSPIGASLAGRLERLGDGRAAGPVSPRGPGGQLVAEATAAFEAYDYARALERTEAFFWSFCDDYVELVKSRAYGTLGEDRGRVGPPDAAPGAVGAAAPVGALPAVRHRGGVVWWGAPESGSIHRARWPSADELTAATGSPEAWPAASEVLGEVRKAKTETRGLAAGPVALGRVAAARRAGACRSRLLEVAADDLRRRPASSRRPRPGRSQAGADRAGASEAQLA